MARGVWAGPPAVQGGEIVTAQQYPEEAGWSWLQKAGCGGAITEATVPQIAFVMERLI